MPSSSFLPLVDGDTFQTGRVAPRNASHITSPSRIWIIVGSVAGVLVLSAFIALVAMHIFRRRSTKECLEGGRQQDPFLGQKRISKHRRMTRDILELEAESQREAMIRKSLVSRSGQSLSLSNQSDPSMVNVEQSFDSRSVQGNRPPNEEGFENGLSRMTTGLGLKSEECWGSRSDLPDMPSRALSRTCSPNRPLQPGRSELPPLLEQHPLFRNMNEESDSENEHS